MGTLTVPTSGTVSGLQNNQDINVALAALATANQGGAAPTSAATGLASVAGVLWHDTANNLLKLRDQADTTWMPFFFVDEAHKLVRPIVPGALFGLTLSNDGTSPNTKVDIAAGFATDDTGAAVISAPLGSSIDFTTTGAGGLDTGALAASTWYHCFIIGKADGTVFSLASTSLTPTLPAGYSFKHRLGSVKTDASAHLLAFQQDGDDFWLKTLANDASSATITTTRTAYTLNSVPPGVRVKAYFSAHVETSTSSWMARLYDPLLSDVTVSASLFTMGFTVNPVVTLTRLATPHAVWANTSQQIAGMADQNLGAALQIATAGWMDTRGRLS